MSGCRKQPDKNTARMPRRGASEPPNSPGRLFVLPHGSTVQGFRSLQGGQKASGRGSRAGVTETRTGGSRRSEENTRKWRIRPSRVALMRAPPDAAAPHRTGMARASYPGGIFVWSESIPAGWRAGWAWLPQWSRVGQEQREPGCEGRDPNEVLMASAAFRLRPQLRANPARSSTRSAAPPDRSGRPKTS